MKLLALGWEVLTTTAVTVLASNALETDQEGDAIQKEFPGGDTSVGAIALGGHLLFNIPEQRVRESSV
ncbi:hypothetical protein U0070_024906 [Myodes glareolus]|uniref:Uncharacterized protein n=1 Tax=Myodes glareolus TaxID=447135 RepID=A0AAW0IT78_MYOGA